MLKIFLFIGEERMDLLLLSWNNFVIMFSKNFEKLVKKLLTLVLKIIVILTSIGCCSKISLFVSRRFVMLISTLMFPKCIIFFEKNMDFSLGTPGF